MVSHNVRDGEENDAQTQRWKLAMRLLESGEYGEAEVLFKNLTETFERSIGNEHPTTLTSAANLALVYQNQGKWAEAEKLEVQLLTTTKRVLGTEHPSTLISMSNLASTYWNL